jgi:hypothetical protein
MARETEKHVDLSPAAVAEVAGTFDHAKLSVPLHALLLNMQAICMPHSTCCALHPWLMFASLVLAALSTWFLDGCSVMVRGTGHRASSQSGQH